MPCLGRCRCQDSIKPYLCFLIFATLGGTQFVIGTVQIDFKILQYYICNSETLTRKNGAFYGNVYHKCEFYVYEIHLSIPWWGTFRQYSLATRPNKKKKMYLKCINNYILCQESCHRYKKKMPGNMIDSSRLIVGPLTQDWVYSHWWMWVVRVKINQKKYNFVIFIDLILI